MYHRSIRTVPTLVALTIAVVGCGSAQAVEVLHRYAFSGQEVYLRGWAQDDAGCTSSNPANAKVLSPSRYGTTTQRIEWKSGGSRYVTGALSKCGGMSHYRNFYYTPQADFSGEDRVALRVFDKSDRRSWDYLFIIDVKADRDGWAGFEAKSITPDIAAGFSMKKAEGVLVVKPIADGPAAKAGIESLDVITAVNGEAVKDSEELIHTIRSMAPGTLVKLYVLHKGQDKLVNVTLGQRPNAEAKTGNEGTGGAVTNAQPAGNPAATNAGDFFAGVGKNATPVAANKPAPAPAGTNAGDFFSQVPTQPEQPRPSQDTAHSGSTKPMAPAGNSSLPSGL